MFAWAALFGDPSAQRGRERNVVWRHFTGLPDRVTHSPAQRARCPADAGLLSPITDLRHAGTSFAALWETGIVGIHETDTKTVDHPDAGPLTLDCDVLIAPGTDLRVVACTTAPGSDGTSSGSSASSAPRP
ncbi:hypothetical protein SK571_14660 [Lentzea sp. BCCO 10_0798]|uniref:MmyB-like transcription regulator ligand binding domain-containing protein n=1 Tax=Lentzea kristufekii TaxID=3095430 RepID=A0ABU4TQQ6_9PSEU|nr:hypothetical protein [Lentzea sp. BCCO 10_0798]MDX8050629.1 hypothetical protein [Lentzea sp. BCCO 10_0798]